MPRNICAFLFAPTPMFICLSWVLTYSELGWRDALISICISFAASYGSMIMICYPIHRLLCQLGFQNILELLICNLIALAIIAILAIIEPVFFPVPENEPALKDGIWLAVFISEGFIMNFSCVLYWNLKKDRKNS